MLIKYTHNKIQYIPRIYVLFSSYENALLKLNLKIPFLIDVAEVKLIVLGRIKKIRKNKFELFQNLKIIWMESKHKKDIQYDKSLSSKQNNKPRKKSKKQS